MSLGSSLSWGLTISALSCTCPAIWATTPATATIAPSIDREGNSIYHGAGSRTFAEVILDPGFSQMAVLWDGMTLKWNFDRDGTLLSREIVDKYGGAQGMSFDSTGTLTGTYETRKTTNPHGVDSFTESRDLLGAVTGRRRVFRNAPGNSSMIDGIVRSCPGKCEVTVDYTLTHPDGPETIEQYSVKSTSGLVNGRFTTTETHYQSHRDPAGRLRYEITGTTVSVTGPSYHGSESRDLDASGKVVNLRRLTIDSESTTTLTRMDPAGRVQGRATQSMARSGSLSLTSFTADGTQQFNSIMDKNGILEITRFDGTKIAGTITHTPLVDHGDAVSYRDATGRQTGTEWQRLSGAHGSQRPLGAGRFTAVSDYPDATSIRIQVDGPGRYSGVVTDGSGKSVGSISTKLQGAALHSEFQSAVGSTHGTVDFHGDGVIEAVMARTGHKSVGVMLTRESAAFISSGRTDAFKAMTIDSEGNESGFLTQSSPSSRSVVIEYYDQDGTSTGRSQRTLVSGTLSRTTYVDLAAGAAGRLDSVVRTEGGIATTLHVGDESATREGQDRIAMLVSADSDGELTKAECRTLGKPAPYPGAPGDFGLLTGLVIERVNAAGDILILTYDGAHYLERRDSVLASGVVEDVLYTTRNGTVTTRWHEDGSYEQTRDDGEGHVNTTRHSPRSLE